MAVTFTSQFSPYLLTDCDGIYTVSNNVTTSDNTMVDGATYQGSVAKKRNIVLTLKDKENHLANRQQLYQLFMPRTKGTFTYEEDDEIRTIDYYVESIDIDSQNRVRTATVSLICPDPYFQATSDNMVEMAGWQKQFEFQHEFLSIKEELGIRVDERIKTITNETGSEGIGLTITIKAIGNVTNPKITLVETGESIQVGTSANPMNLVSGEYLTITTGTNNKNVTKTSGDETTNVNEYLTEDSEFIQLQSGDNTFGYSAASGVDYMTVAIVYRLKYLGV